MDLEEIKARLDQIFSAGTRADPRAAASGLREALVEFKVGISRLREALALTEQQLIAARKEVADYQRRGELARGIGDTETVRVAEEFLGRTRDKLDLLERKVLVQRDELHLAEREYEETRSRYQSARYGIPFPEPQVDGAADHLADPEAERRHRDATVEAQLAHLKQQLNRRD